MKKIFIIMFALVSTILFTQEYIEFNEFGWGQDMSRSKPTFIDIDNDGLLDMIVGEQEGNLNHYEQSSIGSTEFILITTTFNNINVGEYPAPAFTDIDNDGLLDLIIGEFSGNLNHYEQQSIGSYEFVQIATNFNSIDVGSESVPTFADIDNDGLLDMIVGEFSGNLNHYEQFSAGSNNFILITTNFNGIDVGFRSAPSFIDFDEDGILDMIVGEQNGNLNYYQQSALNSNNFTLITSSFNDIDVGSKSFATFIDIDNNSLIDMIIGEQDGNLNHYEQISTHSNEFVIITPIFAYIDVGNNSIPTFGDIDNDGLLDMLIGNNDGNLIHYEQIAVGSDEFGLITTSFSDIDVGNYSAPTLTDLNNDNLLDLIIGEYDGNLNHYQQSSIGSNEFALITTSFNSIDVGSYSTPSFTDIDNDGLLDLIIGENSGYLYHYEQDAEESFEFVLITTSFNDINIGSKSTPIFTDIDHNGLLDLIIGEDDGNLNHYEQTAFDSVEFNLITNSFRNINVESNSTPTFIDIDNDGWEDLFVGTINGGVHYYQIVPPDVILYADFVTLDTLVVVGQQVQFTDLSTAEYTLITSWEWDFDFDGTIDSTGQTPNWTYLVPGEYTVSLTVSDGDFEDTETKINYITVLNSPPFVQNPIDDFSFPEDTIDTSIDLSDVFDDPDILFGDSLTFSYSDNEYIQIEIIDGNVTLTPDPDWFGSENIAFIATDLNFESAEDNVIITVSPLPDSIIVQDLSYADLVGEEWQPIDQVINETETLNFFIDAYDPDGTDLEYSWKLDGVEKSTVNTYDFITDFTFAGDYVVTLDVTENLRTRDELNYTWNVTVNDVDQAIVVNDIQPAPGPVTIDEMDTINFFIDAYDPDGNYLEYSWKLDGVEESTASNYDFTTDYSFAGIYSVTLYVTDNFSDRSEGSRSELNYSWTVTVNDVDQDIVVNDIQPAPGPVTIDETESINFYFSGYDPDGNDLEYSWKLDGVEESTSSAYDFITDYTSAGLYLVTLDVTDNFTDNSLYYEWNVTVNDIDQEIVVNDIQPTPGPVTIDETETINFFIDAYDPDGNDLEYSWKLDGIEVSVDSTYLFTTDYSSAGIYSVTLYVTDNFTDRSDNTRNELNYSWTVTVNDVDQEIVVNDIQPTPGPVTINETETINFFIDAYDPDNNPLEYSWKLDGVEESTSSAYDFITDYTSAGLYLVTLDVTDNFSDNSLYYEWNVTVNDIDQEIVVNDIQPAPGPVTIDEMDTIDFYFSGYDPDGNPLEFSWELDGVEVSIDSTYLFTTDYTSAGLYLVSLDVTDNFSDNSIYYEWNITVNDVDQEIVVNQLEPTPGDVTIDEMETINFFIDAYDPDGNPLEYIWKLDGVEVSTISTYDFTTDYTSAGIYLVTLDVTDNFSDNSIYYEWNVTVNDIDQEIVVNDIQPTPGPVTINETETINFFIDAYDPDGNPLEYSWELDGVEVSTDSIYTFETNYTSAGEYVVTLEVTDNFGTRRISGSVSRNTLNYSWDITVNDVDQPIVVNELIPPEGDITIDEGDVINFSIDAYDPDGNNLEYSWQVEGVEVSTTNSFDFITDENSAGEYEVTLFVTDNFGTRNELNFLWNVTVNDVSGSGEVLMPVITKLFQNHPNPFNPITNIRFDIKENETGVLSIYNTKGQFIESHQFEAGQHNFSWNAKNQSSGVYLYKLQTDSFTEIRKMILLK